MVLLMSLCSQEETSTWNWISQVRMTHLLNPVTTDQAPLQTLPEQPTVRCSGRERRLSDYYGVRVNLSQTVPTTVEEASGERLLA